MTADERLLILKILGRLMEEIDAAGRTNSYDAVHSGNVERIKRAAKHAIQDISDMPLSPK
jgi:hypothetical protein